MGEGLTLTSVYELTMTVNQRHNHWQKCSTGNSQADTSLPPIPHDCLRCVIDSTVVPGRPKLSCRVLNAARQESSLLLVVK